jgi:hypothetical protein
MNRLDRILNLFEEYDKIALENTSIFGMLRREKLRVEKDKLTQELIKHGCRRRD